MSTLPRRLLTLPLLFAATALITLTIPLWLPAALVAGWLLPGARSAARVLGFITAYLWCEVAGVVAAFVIWLRHGRRTGPEGERAWIAANYALQDWWVRALKWWAVRLFRLSFVVEGEDALPGDGALLILRHCSIGDTVLPVAFYNHTQQRRLRFVLKRELLFDPCLDIVGNRLPNYFADRSSQNTAREVEGVKALLEDLPADCGVLIYPEGTRFSPAKRDALLERLREKGDGALLARAERWRHVLPPRPGGMLALLEANPGRDLLFCAHTGFEGSANFASLFNGSWLDTTVRMRFWRVPFAELPKAADAGREFLFDAWDRMNREVEDLL
ncbi:MAG: lysophospholipid acyltransferase family protein [Pseudomonadales bacterium]|nr:lysophospholipid acyltransferase family protein [Pseudomonadales bacterium]